MKTVSFERLRMEGDVMKTRYCLFWLFAGLLWINATLPDGANRSSTVGPPRALRPARWTQQSDPQGFRLGRVSGFLSYTELASQLDSMRLLFPSLISVRETIAHIPRMEKDIWAVRISDNPDVREDEPEILYTAMHHANEPMSMMQLVYFMYYLLENYGTDPEVTYLINERQLYFVPLVNPVGYFRNEQADLTTQFDSHRSTLHPFFRDRPPLVWDTLFVDIGRNYAHEFKRDPENPLANPGSFPFQTYESAAIRDMCVTHQFRVAVNFHAGYSSVTYPWQWDLEGVADPPDDLESFERYAAEVSSRTGYVYGSSLETGLAFNDYLTTGTPDDWMYAEQTTKNKSISLTVSVGPDSLMENEDRLWPPTTRIVPTARENIASNLYLAHVAGFFRDASITISNTDGSPYVDPGETGLMVVTIRNVGQAPNANGITVRLASEHPSILVHPSDMQIGTLMPQQDSSNADSPFVFEVNPDALRGEMIQFTISTESAGFILTDTVDFIVGTPAVAFAHNADMTDGWSLSGQWGLSDDRHEGTGSFTDSPSRVYLNNQTSEVVLTTSLDLSRQARPWLEFWTKWSIEDDYDFASIWASTNQGSTWIGLRGSHMNTASGNGTQSGGAQHGYDGDQSEWLQETIDLLPFGLVSDFRIKFALQTDGWIVSDGWYLDDIRLLAYPRDATITGQPGPYELSSHPNPFNPSTVISYRLPRATHVSADIYNILGQRVLSLISKELKDAGQHRISWNGRNQQGQLVSSGIYIFVMRTPDGLFTRKLMLLK